MKLLEVEEAWTRALCVIGGRAIAGHANGSNITTTHSVIAKSHARQGDVTTHYYTCKAYEARFNGKRYFDIVSKLFWSELKQLIIKAFTYHKFLYNYSVVSC